MITLTELQAEVYEWSRYNFGDQPAVRPLLGIVEEVGELCHAVLKADQGIREAHVDNLKNHLEDALGDILIYMADFSARSNLDLHACVQRTWEKVRERDWRKYPGTGRPV